jgi:hypothetical protein
MSNIVLKTDQTGANDPIYSGNSRIFNFSVTKVYNVASGLFSMKKGSASTDGITATIYNAFNGGGSSVASVFIDGANFAQTFTDMTFDFSNYSLSAGDYSMVLSSTTASGGSSNYFIKSGNFQITDSVTGNVIIVGIGLTASATTDSTLTATSKQGFNVTTSGGVLLDSTSIMTLALNPSISGGVYLNGSSIYAGGTISEIDEQDLYSSSWQQGGRDHWGLTKGIHRRTWSPKLRNQSFSSSLLRNSQSSD